jgi:hypothetical protein
MEHTAAGIRRARRRLRPSVVALAIGAIAAAGVLVAALADSDGRSHRAAHGASTAPASATPLAAAPAPGSAAVAVRVDESRPGRALPERYLGLSFEVTDLPRLARYGARGDLPGLLRSLGPGLLRFGGVSADTRIAWRDASTPPRPWAGLALEEGDLRALRVLAERSDWKVLLTVGLAHYEPAIAAREVAAASHTLGPWLAGIEIGNEPDAYAHHGLRRAAWDFRRYALQVRRYRAAIAAAAPGVALAGPSVSGSHVFTSWGAREARVERPALLTGHHYPLGCHQQPPPTIARLLSPLTGRREAASLQRYMAVSTRARIPFRLDEVNSVSCGGRAGISNTFAAALWGAAYLGRVLGAGVSGINFEGNPANCFGYSPLCADGSAALAAGALHPQPLWYALVLWSRLAGARPLPSSVEAPRGTNVAVSALRDPGGALHFVIVREDPPGAPTAAVALHVGRAYTAASARRLFAPSLEAVGAVDVSQPAPVEAQNGVVTVSLPPASAAIVTVVR